MANLGVLKDGIEFNPPQRNRQVEYSTALEQVDG